MLKQALGSVAVTGRAYSGAICVYNNYIYYIYNYINRNTVKTHIQKSLYHRIDHPEFSMNLLCLHPLTI